MFYGQRVEEMWFAKLDEFSVGYTVLRYLAFPTLIAIVGAILANILLPRWQDRYLKRKAREERRLAIGENILALMNIYVTNWRRLIDIAKYEVELHDRLAKAAEGEKKGIEEALQSALARKQTFVTDRGRTRDGLMDAISRYKMYCPVDSRTLCSEFVVWDEAQSTKGLLELPPIAEWRVWENRFGDIIS